MKEREREKNEREGKKISTIFVVWIEDQKEEMMKDEKNQRKNRRVEKGLRMGSGERK